MIVLDSAPYVFALQKARKPFHTERVTIESYPVKCHNDCGVFYTSTPTGPGSFLLNSRIHDDVPVTFTAAGWSAGVQHFTRVPAARPGVPADWHRLCGSYGPAFIPLVVHEQLGRLYATTENMVDYRLTPVNRSTFRLPPGMYDDEHAVFQAKPDGTIHAVAFCNMLLPRR